MKTIVFCAFLFIFHVRLIRTCQIEFRKLDTSNIVRYVYERNIFNVTGRLRYCPSSISVKNVSLLNHSLKRLSILNVTYFIEKNSVQITGHARLIGFAPMTLELFFRDDFQEK